MCGKVLLCILSKDRCTGETEYLQVSEEMYNVLVALSKMAAVALIKDHHNLLVTHALDALAVVVLLDRRIQLLDGCEDNLLVRIEAFDKLVGILRSINCTRLESLILCLRLCVQVMTVNNKEHLVYAIKF